ncbi:protein translocase subunit SecD [Dethiosulfatarculus sandiegensis]|uniref:Protein translocase subunit SecD n=1 Tax=Dethiosulfatarculus sandiegensis TaxID=1429043 RepID=A0A0D2J6J4_9BACT|nr:protein translocase subunit SecD [Dethiosulfatarculus sandiegensis]KIX11306.1 preprotein translocase subunit SecD [Dethiosulfatarculus sandiegensis]
MSKNLTIKTVLVALVIIAALVCLVPTLGGKIPTWAESILPTEKIHLGLDLQGGMHLVLEVDVEKAVAAQVERNSQDLRREMQEERIRATRPEAGKGNTITLTLLSTKDQGKFDDLIKTQFSDYTLGTATSAEEGKVTYTLTLIPKAVAHIEEMAALQALEKIRNRVDEFGVAEPEIMPQADGRIMIQLPGIKDPQRAVALIGKTAQLTFKLVDDALSSGNPTKATLPPGTELNYEYRKDRASGRVSKTPIVLRKRALMTGDTITDAKVRTDSQFGTPYVSVSFDSRGARQFADLTSRNIKKRLAIVLDGKVQSAPVIQDAITGGQAVITGQFTMAEAKDLAVVLRSGALPAPVRILEERTVGPSLGQDSINQGLLSMVVGFGLVIVFVIVYYQISGLVANVALILNVFLIGAALAAFQASLTLPGIAGIILTIGMAVDANVLIFERIREELRLGKTPAAAIEAGYGKATLTILDANVTTLIAAVVLFQFGTGPIRGFAVTLSIGILSSLFTAIVVTKLIFEIALSKFSFKKLSI